MHLSNVFLGAGFIVSRGGGATAGIYLSLHDLDLLSSVIEIKDLGIRQPNQSLPSRV